MVSPHAKKKGSCFLWCSVGMLLAAQLFGDNVLTAQETVPPSKPVADTSVSPEMARKAYMNCLLEVDKTGESLVGKGKAREAESKSQLQFCDNRKKDCSANLNSPECRTFVEEFAAE